MITAAQSISLNAMHGTATKDKLNM